MEEVTGRRMKELEVSLQSMLQFSVASMSTLLQFVVNAESVGAGE